MCVRDIIYNTFIIGFIQEKLNSRECIYLDNMKTEPDMREYVISNIILTALIVCAVFSGATEIFLMMLIPACLAYIFVRFGWTYRILPIALTVLMPLVLTMQFYITVFILSVPVGAGLAFSLRRKKGLLHAVSAGVFGEIAALILFFVTASANSAGSTSGGLQTEELRTIFTAAVNSAFDVYQIPAQQQAMMYDIFMSVLPALLLSAMVAFSYIASALCLTVLKRRNSEYIFVYRPFSCIKADKTCAVILTIAFAASLITGGVVARTLVNVVIILSLFMFVCGVSVMYFVAKRIRRAPVRLIIYIILATMLLLASTVFMFIGFIDAFINIRRIAPKSE